MEQGMVRPTHYFIIRHAWPTIQVLTYHRNATDVMRMQLHMELEEQRQEGLATAERLAEHQAASHGQLQALQSALSIAKVEIFKQYRASIQSATSCSSGNSRCGMDQSSRGFP